MTRHPRDRPPTPTDLLAAFTELLALRVPIGQEREKQVRGSIAARAAAWKGRMKSGMETEGERLSSDSDNTFVYIAGYREGFHMEPLGKNLGSSPRHSTTNKKQSGKGG